MISQQAIQEIEISSNLNDTELSGLVSWSISWVKWSELAALVISLASAYQFIYMLIKGNWTSEVSWSFVNSVTFLTCSIFANRLIRSGKAFVTVPNDRELKELMVWLNLFWVGLGEAVLILFIYRSHKLAGSSYISELSAIAVVFVATVIVIATAISSIRYECKAQYTKANVLMQINNFAARLLVKLRFVSLLAIIGGSLLLSYGVLDYIFNITDFWWVTSCMGLSHILLGSCIQWYRRSVRDLCRNSTPNYLERSLNRLNFSWIVIGVYFSSIAVMTFF